MIRQELGGPVKVHPDGKIEKIKEVQDEEKIKNDEEANEEESGGYEEIREEDPSQESRGDGKED